MKRITISCLFVLLFLFGNAQSFEVWNGVGLKYKVNKKIQLSGSVEPQNLTLILWKLFSWHKNNWYLLTPPPTLKKEQQTKTLLKTW